MRDINTLVPEALDRLRVAAGTPGAAEPRLLHAFTPDRGSLDLRWHRCLRCGRGLPPGPRLRWQPDRSGPHARVRRTRTSASTAIPSGGVQRVVLSRPGVRTMWDALLSEGRQVLVLRLLGLAQPRRLRSARLREQQRLLAGRVPGQLHLRRRREPCRPGEGHRQIPAQRQHLRGQRSAHRQVEVRGLQPKPVRNHGPDAQGATG
jgi:hypothetical protein